MKTRWIEFFFLSSIYLFLFITIAHDVKESTEQLSYQLHLFTVYATAVLYLLYIYPNFFSKIRMYKWAIWLVCLFFAQSLILFLIQSWRPLPTGQSIPPFALSGIVFLGILIYTAAKTCIEAIYNVCQANVLCRKIVVELLVSCIIGVVVYVPAFQFHRHIAAIMAFSIPFCYVLFAVHYYLLLPLMGRNQMPRAMSIVISVFINIICIILFVGLVGLTVRALTWNYATDVFLIFERLNIFLYSVLSLIFMPGVYAFYSRQRAQQKQIFGLETELGKTSADLKFLQSQINPHFLFNAMNTLYGIALQEQADRTATGIQKLSDMMRFMLNESQQDTIMLSRELEYVREYIALQKLRIADLSSIEIKIELPEDLSEDYPIAPMLLIPFIENAFKHGISLNNPSWIRIQLYVEEKVLKLSVYNSIHRNSGVSDPERDHSGIGLDNVKSRLHILYNNRHQLHIEKTQAEFFVFLTLDLHEIE